MEGRGKKIIYITNQKNATQKRGKVHYVGTDVMT